MARDVATKVINGDCCGNGVVEVKCPYCAKDDTIEDYAASRQACVIQEKDIVLRKDHAYMYQVQTQMYVCNVDFVDCFVD